jgi:hypothetical protein
MGVRKTFAVVGDGGGATLNATPYRLPYAVYDIGARLGDRA